MKKNEIREAQVLVYLTDEYLNTNEPVSSGVLCKKYLPDVSPATVRIDLHKLEKKNLLYQSHSSSGRIPTISGFRRYLSSIEKQLELSSYDNKDFLRSILMKYYKDTPLSLHYIMNILAKETDQLSFVAEPEIAYGYLEKLDVFKIESHKLLFVVRLTSGLDKTVILDCEQNLTESQLKVLVKYVNEELVGLRIYDIHHKHLDEITKKMSEHNLIFASFLSELQNALQEMSNYFIHFEANVSFLNQPEFDSKESILIFLDFIQRHDLILNLIQKKPEKKPYEVLVGEDLELSKLYPFTIVYSKYELFGVPGYLGLIAPIRMNYRKNIPIIRDISKIITETTKRGAIVPRQKKYQ